MPSSPSTTKPVARRGAGGRPAAGAAKRETAKAKHDREYAEMKAKFDAAQEELAQLKISGAQPSAPEVEYEVVCKPEGCAGNGKTGYNLFDSMGMTDSELYCCYLREAKLDFVKAGGNIKTTYRNQEEGHILAACRLMVKTFPELTKKRFPNYWPIRDMIKQFLANHIKHERAMGRIETGKEAAKRRKAERALRRAVGKKPRATVRTVVDDDDDMSMSASASGSDNED